MQNELKTLNITTLEPLNSTVSNSSVGDSSSSSNSSGKHTCPHALAHLWHNHFPHVVVKLSTFGCGGSLCYVLRAGRGSSSDLVLSGASEVGSVPQTPAGRARVSLDASRTNAVQRLLGPQGHGVDTMTGDLLREVVSRVRPWRVGLLRVSWPTTLLSLGAQELQSLVPWHNLYLCKIKYCKAHVTYMNGSPPRKTGDRLFVLRITAMEKCAQSMPLLVSCPHCSFLDCGVYFHKRPASGRHLVSVWVLREVYDKIGLVCEATSGNCLRLQLGSPVNTRSNVSLRMNTAGRITCILNVKAYLDPDAKITRALCSRNPENQDGHPRRATSIQWQNNRSSKDPQCRRGPYRFCTRFGPSMTPEWPM